MIMAKRKSNYSELYSLAIGERGPFYNLCVYCGLPATCRDHVPPISRVDDYRALNLKREIYLLVPSCDQCNNLLADTLQESFVQRVEALKDSLARRFTKTLKKAEWDDDEISELGPSLRSYVAVETAKDIAILKRIEYYAGMDAIVDRLSL